MAKTVMIVEDDPVASRLLEAHLTEAGYRVVTALNGYAALEHMKTDPPAMVITDWAMPEMNGLELCRRIRANDTTGWVYTIVLTAHADPERMIEAIDAGADDFLTKPFNRRELLARFRAGERIVDLERRLAAKHREVHRSKRGLEQAYEKLASANEKLERMALTDVLTKLGNRRAAMDGLETAWARPQIPLACLLLDIDHFKLLNDTYGHDVGDHVLASIAQCLAANTRHDEAIFRIGGEEFLLLCPNASEEMAAVAGERLRHAVADSIMLREDLCIRATVSIGAAERDRGMSTVDDLVKRADEALYAAKRAGRNCVRRSSTSPSMLDQAARRAG